MNFLAFDQAPKASGWAASSDEEGAPIFHGTVWGNDYGDDDQRMMQDFSKEMHKLIDKFQPDCIFFEQIVIDKRHINLPITYAQFSLAATIMFVAMARKIPAEMVLIAQWRKRFLGRSDMPKHEGKRGTGRDWLKEQAKIACLKRNILVANDHEAEAIGILDFGMATKSHAYKWRTKADAERVRLAAARRDMQT